MGFFNFIETSFFISLGITFILILLLVHHFKNRLNNIEQKCDTMFEIINNIVKELSSVRNNQVISGNYSIGIGNPSPVYNNYPFPLNSNLCSQHDKIIVSDEEDDEEEDTDEEEEEDDEEEEDENNINFEFVAEEQDEIKVINVEIGHSVEADISTSDNDNDNGESDNESPVELDEDEHLHIEKIDAPVDESYVETVSERESPKEVYNKMNVQALKALVITKGLSSDPSKLKKNELLKLLESESE